ncbi:hypothetical protein HRbin06_00324 [archaeon HR06]|nr:hypothetical protein HRbin06_00324 [archaeon HR06]
MTVKSGSKGVKKVTMGAANPPNTSVTKKSLLNI